MIQKTCQKWKEMTTSIPGSGKEKFSEVALFSNGLERGFLMKGFLIEAATLVIGYLPPDLCKEASACGVF